MKIRNFIRGLFCFVLMFLLGVSLSNKLCEDLVSFDKPTVAGSFFDWYFVKTKDLSWSRENKLPCLEVYDGNDLYFVRTGTHSDIFGE